ncbi:unnamed protein product [Durusdinium trenchii]|uniref:Amino acid transporter transmembrane domain-containing protein n=1 Tax=Durusdinium trenchii TaxID=1381693 RepID=A0ABP0PP74_9DINO
MVGASVLSLPRMVANNGWALGPGMVLLAGFVSYQACTMVDQAMDHLADTYGQHPRNIGFDLSWECFGQRGRRAVLFLTCVFQISKCGVYFVVIGANLNYALDGMTQRQWALTGALLCMRLMFVQDITVISRWCGSQVLEGYGDEVAYLGWGNQVAGNVLPEGYCLAGAVVSNLMVTAPVVLYCVFRVLEAEHTLLTQPWVNRTLRVTTVTIAVLIALFLPHFTEILAVISTGLLTLLQIFVPVAVTLALRGLGFRELLLCFLGVGMLTAGMQRPQPQFQL